MPTQFTDGVDLIKAFNWVRQLQICYRNDEWYLVIGPFSYTAGRAYAVNKLDIWGVRHHFPRDCATSVWLLWRHQQSIVTSSAERKQSDWDTETMWEYIVVFVVIYGFVMSCKKLNNVCTLVTNCLCAHSSFILVFISLVAVQLGK